MRVVAKSVRLQRVNIQQGVYKLPAYMQLSVDPSILLFVTTVLLCVILDIHVCDPASQNH